MPWRIAGNGGPRSITLSRDAEGYRTYKVVHRVEVSSKLDGPLTALFTPGLPLPGAFFSFGNDVDAWAWCRPDASVKRVSEVKEGAATLHYDVEQTFSNKPPSENQERCNSTSIEDPLLEPQKVSGGFVKYTEEAGTRRDGTPIVTSAGEPLTGSQVEFDKNRPNVRIEQNVASLELALCASMVDTVNQFPLWGLGTRRIKLSNFSWAKKWYGTCYPYYTRTFDFDVMYETFDRTLVDQGQYVLRGSWNKNANSPTFRRWVLADGVSPYGPHGKSDYTRYKDWNGENGTVILDGHGRPWDEGGQDTGTSTDNTMGTIFVDKYEESDFLLLGLPVSF